MVFIDKAWQLRFTIGKFALVGLSGIAVNQGLLALLLIVAGLPVAIAGAIAIEASIISNFHLNNAWTWRQRSSDSFWIKFIKYHLVTLIAGLINYLILVGLSSGGMAPLLANLIGIGAGMALNFVINHFWTFKP